MRRLLLLLTTLGRLLLHLPFLRPLLWRTGLLLLLLLLSACRLL